MRILYACHQFFPECYSGTERYTLELVKQVQRMGHEVLVVTYATKPVGGGISSGSGLLRWTYEYEGVPVIAIRHFDFDRRGGIPGVSFRVQDSAVFQEVALLLANFRADILHCIHPMRVGAILGAAKERNLKVVLTLMDFWMLCPQATLLRVDGNLCEGPDGGNNCGLYCMTGQAGEPLMNRYKECRDALTMADVVISHSQFLIEVFKKDGVDTGRFFHLPNGMDYSKIGFSSHRQGGADKTTISFGFVGTVLPHKGVHILIEAFKKVSLDHIRLKVYGGSFGMHDYFSSLLTLAEGDPRIRFCGEYEYNNVGKILRDIDVVVVPSIWYENAPLVISTAQMFGIPVIATRMGGMEEMVVDGVNGLMCQRQDVGDLADKIRLIATRPEMLKKMSRNKLSPPRIESEAFKLETIYSELINGPVDTLSP